SFGKTLLWLKQKSFGNGFSVSDTKIHNLILRGWSKLGWWGKCKEYWEKWITKDLFSYSIYMDIMCKSGKPWKAIKLYKEMKSKRMKLDVVVDTWKIFPRKRLVHPYERSLIELIRAIGAFQSVEFGIRVFREMKERGCEPNVATHTTIIKLLCEDGRMKDALRKVDNPTRFSLHAWRNRASILSLFGRMMRSGVRPRMDTYVMLMRKFERWGFLQPVLSVWKTMKESGDTPDSAAFNAVIDALVQKGMLDMAREYEDEMVEDIQLDGHKLFPPEFRGNIDHFNNMIKMSNITYPDRVANQTIRYLTGTLNPVRYVLKFVAGVMLAVAFLGL
ncbi:unnamed protein product, partial [Thlaspi arvense]